MTMLNEGAFQSLNFQIKDACGDFFNYQDLIKENDGYEERALKVFASSAYTVCKMYNKPAPRVNNPIAQKVIDGRVADDKLAAQWD